MVEATLVASEAAVVSSAELQAETIPTSPTAAATPIDLTTRFRVRLAAELELWLNFVILDAFLMSARYRSGVTRDRSQFAPHRYTEPTVTLGREPRAPLISDHVHTRFRAQQIRSQLSRHANADTIVSSCAHSVTKSSSVTIQWIVSKASESDTATPAHPRKIELVRIARFRADA